MLNIYDINENFLLFIEMGNDKKVFCFNEMMGSEIVFSINQYHYNTESKEIKNTTLLFPICGTK